MRHNHILFIVVATPVEEIGRDHDFDWAIIEPSSTQSIIQTAGRVNRHRLLEIEKPNIGILQYNARHCRNVANGATGLNCAFIRPGLESEISPMESKSTHPIKDVGQLLPWDEKNEISPLNASLRFGDSLKRPSVFSENDDKGITRQIKESKDIIFSTSQNEFSNKLVAQNLYDKMPLRDKNKKDEWKIINGDYLCRSIDPLGNVSWQKKGNNLPDIERRKNDWLCWDLPQLESFCKAYGIAVADGLRFDLTVYSKNNEFGGYRFVRDKSFGIKRAKNC